MQTQPHTLSNSKPVSYVYMNGQLVNHSMKRKIIIYFIILMCAALSEAMQEVTVSITSPLDNAEVGRPAKTEGIVSYPNSEVYVIVHPVGVPEFWVQPKASVQKDGKWSTTVYLGQKKIRNPDKQYELMAIADPFDSLKAGDMLRKWPNSKWRSQVIRVKRRQSTKQIKYHIQVGTWRKHQYANDVLTKLKKDYPQVYLRSSNDFSIIMIPDIKTESQGRIVIRDIENKFKLSPILKSIK